MRSTNWKMKSETGSKIENLEQSISKGGRKRRRWKKNGRMEMEQVNEARGRGKEGREGGIKWMLECSRGGLDA